MKKRNSHMLNVVPKIDVNPYMARHSTIKLFNR